LNIGRRVVMKITVVENLSRVLIEKVTGGVAQVVRAVDKGIEIDPKSLVYDAKNARYIWPGDKVIISIEKPIASPEKLVVSEEVK
jgi:hypothetical protein